MNMPMTKQIDPTQLVIIQAMRTGLWLPVIQTLLWLMHGGRDGTFQAWSQAAFGETGDAAFWVLCILWMSLALLPLVIAISDHRGIRWLTLGFSVFFLLAASLDWVGEQNSEIYQYPLKVAHTSLALVMVWFCWRWLRQKNTELSTDR